MLELSITEAELVYDGSFAVLLLIHLIFKTCLKESHRLDEFY